MKHIISPDNPLIKNVAKLKTKKGRQIEQQFLAEGIRTCTTIIESGIKPLHIFATQEIAEKVSFLNNQNVTLVPQKVIEKISPATTPSGLVCVFPIPEQPSFDMIQEGIILAGIQDPGNMGTLIRTAISFGKKTIILVEGAEPWNPKVVQASAGTLAIAHIFRMPWNEVIALKDNNFKLTALVVKNGQNPAKMSFDKTLLIIGSEAHGIPDSWLKSCENLMTIPMPGKTESLNAAAAGAIAMYLAWAPK